MKSTNINIDIIRFMIVSMKNNNTLSVYHLHYNLERRIISYPKDEDLDYEFDDEFTPEMCRKQLQDEINFERKGRVHLATGKTSSDVIRQKAEEELKKFLTDAFYDVCLPKISMVQRNQQRGQNGEVGETAPIITMSTSKVGHSTWSWKFRALDSNCNCNHNHGPIHAESKCLLECVGTVSVKRERLSKMLESHMLQFEMKRRILSYGHDVYTDCMASEMEDAEEHIDGELEYNQSGEKVIEYNLQDMNNVNAKATTLVKEMLDTNIGDMGDLAIQEFENNNKDKNESNKPVVFKSTGDDGFARWEWNFAADENNYGCSMECEGSINIILKQSANPDIPMPSKKRCRYTNMALPRKKIMHTNIVYTSA